MPAIPYLKYEDVNNALEWLAKAFQFNEKERFSGEDGRVFHAEMTTAAGDPVYLAGPGADYQNPNHTGHLSAMVSVDVDDVDDQFQQASAVGAHIHFPPTDTPNGRRVCKIEDPEGHEWFFSQRTAAL